MVEHQNKRRRVERITDAEKIRDEAMEALDNDNQYASKVRKIVDATTGLGGRFFNNGIQNNMDLEELYLLKNDWFSSDCTKAPVVAKLVAKHFNEDYATLSLIQEDINKALKVVNSHFESLYLKEYLKGVQLDHFQFQKYYITTYSNGRTFHKDKCLPN